MASLTAARPIPLAQLRTVLPPQAILLEFFPLDHQLVLFAIDVHGLRVGVAPVTMEQLEEWTEQLDAAMMPTGLRHHPKSAARKLRLLLAGLGDALKPMLQELLGEATPVLPWDLAPELILVPTGPLHRWPLHLMPWGGGILWDSWAISYVPTADTLFYCAGRHPGAEQPLLLAPDPGLPGALGEAVLAEAMGWEVVVQETATPLKLARSKGSFSLVTHVEPSPQQGGSSLIKLWVGSELGRVTAVEVLRLMRERPSAEHGELGSCAAHYEEAREGDHLQGLTRSLLKRLRSLTTTLWHVNDLAACYIGTRVRELMAKGAF